MPRCKRVFPSGSPLLRESVCLASEGPSLSGSCLLSRGGSSQAAWQVPGALASPASQGCGGAGMLGFPGALAADPCGQLTPLHQRTAALHGAPVCLALRRHHPPEVFATILGDGTSVIPILQTEKLRLREVTQVTWRTRGGARLLALSLPTARGQSRCASQKSSVTPGPCLLSPCQVPDSHRHALSSAESVF